MKNIPHKLLQTFRLVAIHCLVLLLVAAPSTVAFALDVSGNSGSSSLVPLTNNSTVGNQAGTTGIGGTKSYQVGNTSGITISSGSNSGNGSKFSNPLGGNTSLAGLLEKILNVVIQLGAVVVVFFYIYAGFKYVIARGDEGEIKSATKTLTWTTVGAMVILGAQVISTAIQGTVSQISSGK